LPPPDTPKFDPCLPSLTSYSLRKRPCRLALTPPLCSYVFFRDFTGWHPPPTLIGLPVPALGSYALVKPSSSSPRHSAISDAVRVSLPFLSMVIMSSAVDWWLICRPSPPACRTNPLPYLFWSFEDCISGRHWFYPNIDLEWFLSFTALLHLRAEPILPHRPLLA